MKTFLNILTPILSIFLICGAIFVNFPNGEYVWAIYDMFLAFLVIEARDITIERLM